MFVITVQRSRVGWPWRWWRVRGPNRIWLVQRCRHGSDEQIRRPANDRFDRINHLFYGHWDTLCYNVWVCFQRDRSQHFSRLFKLFSFCTNSEHCNIFFSKSEGYCCPRAIHWKKQRHSIWKALQRKTNPHCSDSSHLSVCVCSVDC